MHGPGVSTPSAAAVWAAVIGLARLVHSPNGKMLTNGLLSMIVATGMFSTVRFSGRTMSVLGAMPKLHIVCAPLTTGSPTTADSSSRRQRATIDMYAPKSSGRINRPSF